MTAKSNTFVEAALHYEKNVFEQVRPVSVQHQNSKLITPSQNLKPSLPLGSIPMLFLQVEGYPLFNYQRLSISSRSAD